MRNIISDIILGPDDEGVKLPHLNITNPRCMLFKEVGKYNLYCNRIC